MTLHLYLARRFLVSFLGVLAIFACLQVLIDLIEQIRRFGNTEASLGAILGLTFLRMPEGLYQILPLVMILSTLALFLSLARSSELVVTRASGRSALRSLIAPSVVAALIGVFGVVAVNPIVAATSKQYDDLANSFRAGGGSVLSISREGLWLRQGADGEQTVIRAARANLDGTELFGVSFLGFGREGRPSYRIEAERARLTPGAWQIENAKEWRFEAGQNAEQNAVQSDSITVPSDLTRDGILDSFGTPSAIPIWELPAFIERMERAGFSATSHRVWYHMELALPLLLVAMMLTGAVFTMRHTRFGRTGLMVMLALGLGFGLFFIREFAQVLGENGQIPVILAAWGPAIAALLLPIGLLLHLEDG